MVTLKEVKQANKHYFAKANMSFLGDKEYKILHGCISGKPFLITYTKGFSDLLNEMDLYYYYVIHYLNDDLTLGSYARNPSKFMLEFKTIEDVKQWLREN